ncbi:phospho-N-acetylmuramoyl-pentapeptide-transferase [Iamia sp. SCSIO 61187]|uniref:phospho-N-acetylmuramoyl-pentapeptide- transferase n=1 Tax=Iamia sp. SCSIO 61187 TaxID=2722752 RepID=UPI001C6268F0|nr:phospho-N-acetylmuramoyl-pentapeptide-transferase [Iamia sp. SCSIO 61187]QYG92797.1 phospho-N-acetylmuramoyl-pentapeptide-transferase [Iamia sp. SCSIO 61187]
MIALLMAAGVGLATSLVGTRFLIVWLRQRGIGQPIHEDVPDAHRTKAGTPTMGGIAIVAGATIGYLVSHTRPGMSFSTSGILLVLLVIGAGVVGGLDDWIKVSQERNLGLSKAAKSIGLLSVAIGFAVAAVAFTDVHTNLSFTRFDNFEDLDLGPVLWVVWAVLLIVGCTNAVNLTDGLDGLAGGSAISGFAAFTVIAFWAYRNNGQPGALANYQVPDALDVATVAAALAGATTGFLWWNATPARIFMGDTGSLAIGGGLAGMALLLNTHLLLPLIGGLFVFETLSVIVQVAGFRLFKKRPFRMAPIHHHYEFAGWPQTTIIVRFWILAGLSTAIALGLYLADFIHLTGQ